MATTSLLIILPDSSWKNSYEFSKINHILKITWAGLFFLDFLSAHCFPSEDEFFACRRNFGARACPAHSLPCTPRASPALACDVRLHFHAMLRASRPCIPHRLARIAAATPRITPRVAASRAAASRMPAPALLHHPQSLLASSHACCALSAHACCSPLALALPWLHAMHAAACIARLWSGVDAWLNGSDGMASGMLGKLRVCIN